MRRRCEGQAEQAAAREQGAMDPSTRGWPDVRLRTLHRLGTQGSTDRSPKAETGANSNNDETGLMLRLGELFGSNGRTRSHWDAGSDRSSGKPNPTSVAACIHRSRVLARTRQQPAVSRSRECVKAAVFRLKLHSSRSDDGVRGLLLAAAPPRQGAHRDRSDFRTRATNRTQRSLRGPLWKSMLTRR